MSVVIDAAQARVPSAAVRDFLAAGASVMVTGSKALGAPPFCGAIVLDPALMHGAMTAVSRGKRLPRGFAHIVALADMPRWLRGMLPGAQHANLGLLARWHVGLGELDRYRAIPSVWRADFTHRLCSAITAQLRSTPGIVVLDSDSPSIVSFGLRTSSGDLAPRAPVRDLYAALVGQPGVQFGQPVELAPGRAAVLRYAIGVVTASRLAATGQSPADAALGATAAAIAAVRGALLEVQV